MKAKSKEDRIAFRMRRATDTLKEIETLIEEEFLHTSANRIYYASFYAVKSLLISIDEETKTHAGARSLFAKHFIQSGIIEPQYYRFYSEIFDYRHEVDYDEIVDLDLEKIKSLYKEAKLLVSRVEKYLSEMK